MTADGIRTKIVLGLRRRRFLLRVGKRSGDERDDGKKGNKATQHERELRDSRSTHATPALGWAQAGRMDYGPVTHSKQAGRWTTGLNT
jgi:hypothetical protein